MIYLDVAFRCQHGKSTSFFENAPALNLQLCSGIRFVFSEGYRIFFMYLLSMLLYNVLTYMFGYFSGEMLGNHGYFSMNDRGGLLVQFPHQKADTLVGMVVRYMSSHLLGGRFPYFSPYIRYYIYIYVYTSTLLNINSVYRTVSYIYIHQ
jgi:hypothetical protein